MSASYGEKVFADNGYHHIKCITPHSRSDYEKAMHDRLRKIINEKLFIEVIAKALFIVQSTLHRRNQSHNVAVDSYYYQL